MYKADDLLNMSAGGMDAASYLTTLWWCVIIKINYAMVPCNEYTQKSWGLPLGCEKEEDKIQEINMKRPMRRIKGKVIHNLRDNTLLQWFFLSR